MINWFRKHKAWSTYAVDCEIKNKDSDKVEAVISIHVDARSGRQAKNYVKDNYELLIGKSKRLRKLNKK